MKLKLYILLIPAFLLFCGKAHAQWPVGKYRDMFVPSVSFYGADDSWDTKGNKVSDNGSFQSYALNLYNVYGLTRKLDIESSLPIALFNDTYKGKVQNAFGPADLQVGLNYNILNVDFSQFVNITASGIVPLYNNKSPNDNLGYGEAGADIRVDYFANISKDVLKRSYFTASAGFRRYFGTDGPDQYSASGTFSVGVFNATSILFNAAYLKSVSDNKDFNTVIVDIKDFDYFKTSLTVGQVVSRRVSFFLGGFYTLFGRNTGVGYGGNFSTVIKM